MDRQILSFIVACCVTASVSFAAEHEVKLFRPAKVGEVFEVKGEWQKVTKNTLISADGSRKQPLESGSVRYVFELVEKTLKKDEFGNDIEAEFEIKSLKKMEKGNETVLAKAGTRIKAISQGKDPLKIEAVEGEVTGDARRALEDIISLPQDKKNMDDIFPADGKKSPGDSWPIDKKIMAELISTDGTQNLDADKIEGNMTLVQEARSGNVPCLKFQMLMDIGKAVKSIPDLPPNVTFKSAEMTVNGTVLLPIDTKLQPVEHSMVKKSVMILSTVQNNESVDVQLEETVTENVKRKQVK